MMMMDSWMIEKKEIDYHEEVDDEEDNTQENKIYP